MILAIISSGVSPRNKSAAPRNHFSFFAQTSGNSAWLSSRQRERRAAPATKPGDRQMRTVSFILAFAFVVGGPSMAGWSAGNLPGVGTFAYSGSPIAVVTPQTIVVATR